MIQTQSQFSQKVIDWYYLNGRKTLPWQLDKNIYKVWISEIMLQQTQVMTVIPYFQRFIAKFPDVIYLANASLNEILHLWSGLGYYSRAHYLHKSANIIVKQHHGIFPTDFDSIIALPGIGRSTAGAILSLTFGQHYPILDGNVKRILSRYYAILDGHGTRKTEQHLWKLSKKILPEKGIMQFNQAMMDIGTMLCTRSRPKCDICPLNYGCKTYIHHIWKSFPRKKLLQRSKQEKTIWFLILQHENQIWLEQREMDIFWGGLFCFPQFSTYEELNLWLIRNDIKYVQRSHMDAFRHTFSHFHLKIIPIWLSMSSTILNFMSKKNKNGTWYDLMQPPILGLSAPIRRLLLQFKKNN